MGLIVIGVIGWFPGLRDRHNGLDNSLDTTINSVVASRLVIVDNHIWRSISNIVLTIVHLFICFLKTELTGAILGRGPDTHVKLQRYPEFHLIFKEVLFQGPLINNDGLSEL